MAKYICIRSFELSGERGFRAGAAYELDAGLVSRLRALGGRKDPEGAMAFFKAENGGIEGDGKAPPPAPPDVQGGDQPSKDDLKARARELKIKLHGNESYQKLQSLIAEAETPPPEAA